MQLGWLREEFRQKVSYISSYLDLSSVPPFGQRTQPGPVHHLV